MPSRRRSRQRALQILYLWDVRRQPVEEATRAYFDSLYSEESRIQPQRDAFLDQLVTGSVEHLEELDRQIGQHAEHWRIERMPIVDRNILRLAVYEMMHSDTPAPVVIDEALELARRYSNEESVLFVNGVLDAVHRDLERAQLIEIFRAHLHRPATRGVRMPAQVGAQILIRAHRRVEQNRATAQPLGKPGGVVPAQGTANQAQLAGLFEQRRGQRDFGGGPRRGR